MFQKKKKKFQKFSQIFEQMLEETELCPEIILHPFEQFKEEEKDIARVLLNGETDAKSLVQLFNGRGIFLEQFQDYLQKNPDKAFIADLFFVKASASHRLFVSQKFGDYVSCYYDW